MPKLPSDQDASGRDLGAQELELLREVIESGTLTSTKGHMVNDLELEFAQLVGSPHAVACASGSAAVHIAVAALNLEPGDEVITTPVTDMGALAHILFQGLIPVFADTDPAITSLRVDDEGLLWVLSSRGDRDQPDGILCSYDVFDQEGSYLRRVQVACPGNGQQDRLMFVGHGLVFQITRLTESLAVMRGAVTDDDERESEDDDGVPMEVICHRIRQ